MGHSCSEHSASSHSHHSHQGHQGHHGHHHHGHHHHAPTDYNRLFMIGVALNLGFVVVETAYGWVANSLSLLADAGHNFSDVIGLLLAWGAFWLAGRRASPQRTYGLGRSTVLSSLFNAMLILLGMGAIAAEACQRLLHPQAVENGSVMAVAALGVVLNGLTALLFLRGGQDDLNLRGAFLHMAADAGVSVGVVLSAFCMQQTGWLWLDPVVSLLIVVIIVIGTWGLLRESVHLALDGVPAQVDRQQVEAFLRDLPGVTGLHDLHIWALSTQSIALTVHVQSPQGAPADQELYHISEQLRHQFGIHHSTMQWERGDAVDACPLHHAHG